MKIKFLADEDFVNYKLCSMFIGFPHCSFKCDKESGCNVCQNSKLALEETIDYPVDKIYNRYIENPLTKAIVIGGLEPFDTFEQLIEIVSYFRERNCNDTFIIYTGYTEEEFNSNKEWNKLLQYNNLIIKFGRFVPNQKKHFDDILGVELASDNQYAILYIKCNIIDVKNL